MGWGVGAHGPMYTTGGKREEDSKSDSSLASKQRK